MSSFTLLVAAIVVLDPTYWKLATRHLKLPFRIAIPAPQREARKELNTFFRYPDSPLDTRYEQLSLRILEPLPGTLLTVLLALLATRVAADHTFSLELLTQFAVE